MISSPAPAPSLVGTLPNFVIIGAQKAGTRWLRSNLGKHPDIHTAPRELEFFNHNWHRGPRWYAGEFAGWRGEKAVGEATPGYMMWNERPDLQAAKIDGLLPDARILAILRNPIDRAHSALIHFAREGRVPSDRTLVEHTMEVPPREDPVCIVAGSWYAQCLSPYVRRFGDRLLVVLQDDVKTDPAKVYRDACTHIGVDGGFLPDELGRVRFSNPVPEGSAYATESGERRGLSPEEREAVYPYFADEIERLEKLVDLDLSRWKL